MDNIKEILTVNLGQWELIIRFVVACLCGGIIGLERSHRQKEAGLRTHIILALASALVMVVSKYGFFDIPLGDATRVDASRVASNVVTGVSFLCAGVIFVRGGSIKGLTTAAGIWATAGVGLAIGSGMYMIGLVATFLIVLIQIILHRFLPASETMETNEITFTAVDDGKMIEKVKNFLIEQKIKILGIEVKKGHEGYIKVRMTVKIAKNAALENFIPLINEEDGIRDFSVVC